ncbi:hypothetical protein KJ966_10970 [bacterium]|nr:hypothetical protein [bacterium]
MFRLKDGIPVCNGNTPDLALVFLICVKETRCILDFLFIGIQDIKNLVGDWSILRWNSPPDWKKKQKIYYKKLQKEYCRFDISAFTRNHRVKAGDRIHGIGLSLAMTL